MRISESRSRALRYGAAGSRLPSTAGRGGAWILRDARVRRQHAVVVIIISILAVVARLVLINQPYVDHWSWRQNDVAAIARNFLQDGFHFGYPQIDWAGSS